MMKTKPMWLACVATLGLGACAAIPPAGPSVMVLPGNGRNFDSFRQDQAICDQYAQGTIGPVTVQQAASNSAMNSAVAGAAIGAAAGAVIGAASGQPDEGAAVGAGVGLLAGSAAGAEAYNQTAYAMQDRYDVAFVQCMYAKGHQVPVPAGLATSAVQQPAAMPLPPPPSQSAAPPGYPLPPPPKPPGTR